MAPEVIKEQQTDRGWKKADIWSVGCTVIEMATGKPPWCEFTNPLTCMFHISSEDVIPAFPPDSSRHQLDFLQRCLQRQPEKRPDVTSLLLHQFVAFAPTNVAADRLCLSMLDQRRPNTADAPSSRHSSRFGASHSRHSTRRPEHPMSPGARLPSGRASYGGYGGGPPSPIRLPSRASSAAGRAIRRRNSLDPTAQPPSRASTAVGLNTKNVQWLREDEAGDEDEEEDDDDDSLVEDIKGVSVMSGSANSGDGDVTDAFGDRLASPRSTLRAAAAVEATTPAIVLGLPALAQAQMSDKIHAFSGAKGANGKELLSAKSQAELPPNAVALQLALHPAAQPDSITAAVGADGVFLVTVTF